MALTKTHTALLLSFCLTSRLVLCDRFRCLHWVTIICRQRIIQDASYLGNYRVDNRWRRGWEKQAVSGFKCTLLNAVLEQEDADTWTLLAGAMVIERCAAVLFSQKVCFCPIALASWTVGVIGLPPVCWRSWAYEQISIKISIPRLQDGITMWRFFKGSFHGYIFL